MCIILTRTLLRHVSRGKSLPRNICVWHS